MDTLKIKTEATKVGFSGFAATTLCVLMMAQGFASDTSGDEYSLANRLKEFNQPDEVAKPEKVAVKKPSSTRIKRSASKIACYRSSASAIRNTAKQYQAYISANSRRYGVDEHLIMSVITAESCFAQHARSHKGAQGLMQLIPATAKRFGVNDAYQPAQNIRGGTRYLQFLMKRFSGNLQHVIAAYNAGEGAVDRYRGIPPYKETQEYVRRVMAVYNRLNGVQVIPASSEPKPVVQKAVLKTPAKKDTRGYFIKPDYKWKRKPGKQASTAQRVSRSYPVKNQQPQTVAARFCRDNPSSTMRRTTDLIKRTTQWSRTYQVKKAESLSQISRRTGVPVKVLLRLNRGISRLSVKPGTRVLVWHCSVRP